MKVSITYDDTLYQLVPKEPTDTMLVRGSCAMVGDRSALDELHRGWNEMLSAAPTPPAQPAERKPLSEDEIHDMWIRRKCMAAIQSGDLMAQLVHLVRVVEAAHGITEQKP